MIIINFINVENNIWHFLVLKKWLNQKEVLEFYEGFDKNFTYKKVKAKFKEKILNKNIYPLFIIFKNKKIGYLQFYNLNQNEKENLNYHNNLKIIGFDLFLSKKYQNKGLGEKVIKSFIKYLELEKINYHKLIADPISNNLRAINCYKKCGFNSVNFIKKFQLHNGIFKDVVVMEYV